MIKVHPQKEFEYRTGRSLKFDISEVVCVSNDLVTEYKRLFIDIYLWKSIMCAENLLLAEHTLFHLFCSLLVSSINNDLLR